MGAKFLKLLLCSLLMILLGACSGEEVSPWVKVGEVSVYQEEMMLYLYQTYNDFEEHGGKDVWLIEDFSGGKSAGQIAKQGALDNLIRSKVMVQKSREMGIEVDQATRLKLKAEALSYFEGLPSFFVASYKITLGAVEDVFMENYLTSQVTERTTSHQTIYPEQIQERLNKNPDYVRLAELNPSEVLTTYRVQHLVIRTHERDEFGDWQPLSDQVQDQAKATIDGLYQELLDGGSFREIVRQASQTDYYIEEPEGIILSRAQLPEDYIRALDLIEEGQFTKVIHGEYGYNIFYLEESKSPSSMEFEQYERRFLAWENALKEEAEAAMISEAIHIVYKRWRDATEVTYSDQWLNLDFIDVIQTFIETGSEQ